MDCKEIQTDLSAYIDRELTPADEQSIRLHLGDCESCAVYYKKMLRGWQALEAWEDVTPSDRMRRKILDSARPQRKATSLRAVLALAAALLLVIGIAVYYSGLKGRSLQDIANSQPPVQTSDIGDMNEDEIIANLLILQENDFFEALDELVMIDDLPLAEEPPHSSNEPERGSLDLVFT